MPEHVDPLLLAVERLVRPHREPVITTAHGRSWIAVDVRPPLLEQLAAADTLRAVELRDEIHAACVSFSRTHGLEWRPASQDDRTLVAWYRVHTARVRAGEISADHHALDVLRARRWVEEIEALLTEPDVLPISSCCPACGAQYADLDGERVQALAALVWRQGAEAIGKISATCRACSTDWDGKAGSLILLGMIEAHERTRDRRVGAELRRPPKG